MFDDALICSNCGKKIPLHGKVCPYCNANKEKDKEKFMIVFVIVVVFIMYLIFS